MINDSNEVNPDPTVPIESLDMFVRFMTMWHEAATDRIRHFLEIPEGAEFEVSSEESTEAVVLTSESHRAFKLGVEMALMQVSTLPFVAEMEDTEPVAP